MVELPPARRLGLSLDDLVVYELHVGTFSAEGTFDGVVPYLGGLRELGVTAIELMPVATFPGDRGWGYDGVYAYAPHPAYGGPEGLARLVAAAHGEGLGVILDVVYNHLGPGSEALTAFGPYLSEDVQTFWGAGLDFSQAGVREWAIQNALCWVEDYGIDGLRLDAVRAIRDPSPQHVLAELAGRVHATAPHALVIAETSVDDDQPLEDWRHDARWADGLHHALHALLTGEREGYYAPYGSLADVVAELGRRPAERHIVCAQDHDQVGNRALGDRLLARCAPRRLGGRPLLPADAAPLHGGGVRGAEPLPVLHRPRLARDRLGRQGRPQAGVRRLVGVRRRGRAGSRRTRRPSCAPSSRDARLPAFATTTAGCSPCDVPSRARCRRRRDGPKLTMRRGHATLVADFDARTVELDA